MAIQPHPFDEHWGKLATAVDEALANTDSGGEARLVAALDRFTQAVERADQGSTNIIEMWMSWERDARRRTEVASTHLRHVLEIAETWQPSYATAVDIQTLKHARGFLG